MWYYKRVTQMRYYGIPTNKKYALVVYDRNGRLVVLNGNDGQIDTAVQALVQGAPWAIGGYNTELKAQWINAKTRPAFIEAVDQRRRSQS